MAFPGAGGYANLPQGNFTPVIYSQKVLKFFRTASVSEAITNTDYAGEIENYGDTVRIIKEPVVTVSAYARGAMTNIQDLADDDISLIVDQGNYFAFKVDDVEERQSHVNWESLAVSSGAYKLKDSYDENIIAAMIAGAGTTIGSDGSGQDVGHDAGEIDPLNVLANHCRRMNSADVPEENRWFLAPPQFYEELGQSTSRLIEAEKMGDGPSRLLNGRTYGREVQGFALYMTNNFAASSTSNYYKVLSGHMSATATASHIAKTEVIRDPDSFADIVRGLHVFGRKVIRSEALFAEHVLID